MLIFLVYASSAFAQGITCEALVELHRQGVVTDQLIGLVETSGVAEGALPCILQAALPEPVKYAAQEPRAPWVPPAAGESDPTGGQSPPTPRPLPKPELDIDAGQRAWLREDPCSPINLAERLPERGVAMVLSGAVGFGTGHFYARQRAPGILFLVGEGLSLGVSAIGYANMRADLTLGDTPDSAMLWTGTLAYSLLRLGDFATTYRSATVTRASVLADCGW